MMAVRKSEWAWGGAIATLAVVVRVAAILVLSSHTVPRSTYEHGEIAANLVAGKGFAVRFLGADGPTSQQAPLYPYVLAAAYWVGGVETPASLLMVQLGQAGLAGLMVGAVLVIGREIAPGKPWVGRMAGLVAALHPTLIYAATHIQVAMVAATFMAVVMALAFRSARLGSLPGAAATGLMLGLLVLTDPILGLAAVGVGLAWLMERGWIGAMRGIAVAGIVSVLVIAPWIARNYRVHGELVFIKSTFGYAFWQGNCFGSEGTDKVVRASVEEVIAKRDSGGLRGWNRSLWAARHEAGYIDDILLTKADYARLGAMSEPERSRDLFRRAMDDIRAEPARYFQLTARRLRYFFVFDETNPKTRSIVYRAGHLGLTALALFGWCLLGRNARRRLMPTVAVVLLIAGFHATTIVSARFHIPIEPFMAVWAGAGLAGAGEVVVACLEKRKARRETPAGGIPGLAAKEASRWAVAQPR